MKKNAKKVDIIIIITLVLILLFGTLSVSLKSKADTDYVINDHVETLDDYKEAKIGILTGSNYDEFVGDVFPDGEYVYFNDLSDIPYALSQGKIDCYFEDLASLKETMREYPLLGYLNETFGEIDYGAMFAKTERGEMLCRQYNEFLSKVKSDGRYDKLEAKWINQDDSQRTLDEIKLSGENGKIKIVTNSALIPFAYNKEGKLVGFDVELALMFCEEYGYDCELVDVDSAAIITGIATDIYDIGVGSFTITEERKQSVNFSNPTYTTFMTLAIYNATNSFAATNGVYEKTGFISSVKDSFEKTFIKESRWKLIVEGIGTTLLITILSTVFGTVLAFLVCMFRRTGSKLADMISNIYVALLRGTPMLVLLMIFFYLIFGKSGIPPVLVAVIAFTLNLGAYGSEIMMSGIKSIDAGQREAALAIGYTENQAFFKFVFPQAALRFLPVYKSEIVSLLKGTSIVGYIAIQDLTKMSDIIRSRTFDAFFPLVSGAIIYFILSWIFILVIDSINIRIDPKRKGGTRK